MPAMIDDEVMESGPTEEKDSVPQVRVPPRKWSWSKATFNFWLDAALAAVFVALVTVSTLLRCVFPSPTAAAGWRLWGYDYDQWVRGQFIILCALGVGIVLHVMLHWSWVCGMLTRGKAQSSLRTDNGVQTIVGVLFLAAILHIIGFTILAGMLSIVSP